MHCWPLRRSACRPAWLAATVSLLAVLGVAGCTTPPPATATASGGEHGGPGYGIIVAMRPPAPAGDTRRSVLAALGAPAAASDGRVEFIIRGDDGQPVSVMQAPDGGLRTGDRVALIPGARLRIARASAGPTAP